MKGIALNWTGTSRTTTSIGIAALALALGATGRAAAIEGPVVLGGDNFPRHGQFNTTTQQTENGWLAMQGALAWVAPRVGRVNDNSVAAIGARSSVAISDDAGAAIRTAASAAGLTTTYHDGADAINRLFADLASGAVRPRVIWIAGSSATNMLDTAELTALAQHGPTLAAFIRGGGGLISHGDETVYAGWLPAVAPGLETLGGMSVGLALTSAGALTFPGVTNAAISTGGWRNAFLGDLNGLDVLATSTDRTEPDTSTPRKVVLGGGRAWSTLAPADLTVTSTAPASVDRGDIVRYDLRVTNNGPNLATGVVLTHELGTKLIFRGAADGAGRACLAGPPVTCSLGDLAVGASASAVVFGRARSAGSITPRSRVTSQVPDALLGDNEVTTTSRALTTKLRLRVETPPYGHGRDLMRVRIEVRNTGSRAAKNVILRSPAPNGFTLERRPAGARAEGRALVWDLGTIRPGRTKALTFRIRINDRTNGRICLPARLAAANANPLRGRDCMYTYVRHLRKPVANHPHKGL